MSGEIDHSEDYKIVLTNFSSILTSNSCAFPIYQPRINFLYDHNYASCAIKACVILKIGM